MALHTSLENKEEVASVNVSTKSFWSEQLNESKNKLDDHEKDFLIEKIPYGIFLIFVLILFIFAPLILRDTVGQGNYVELHTVDVQGAAIALDTQNNEYTISKDTVIPETTGVATSLGGFIETSSDNVKILIDEQTTLFLNESLERYISLELRDGTIFIDSKNADVFIVTGLLDLSVSSNTQTYIASLDGELIVNVLSGKVSVSGQSFSANSGEFVFDINGDIIESEIKYFRDSFIERATLL